MGFTVLEFIWFSKIDEYLHFAKIQLELNVFVVFIFPLLKEP